MVVTCPRTAEGCTRDWPYWQCHWCCKKVSLIAIYLRRICRQTPWSSVHVSRSDCSLHASVAGTPEVNIVAWCHHGGSRLPTIPFSAGNIYRLSLACRGIVLNIVSKRCRHRQKGRSLLRFLVKTAPPQLKREGTRAQKLRKLLSWHGSIF